MTTNQTSQALIGAFRNRLAAEEFVNEVLRRGYTRSEVSLLMIDQPAGYGDAYKNYDDTVTRSEVAAMENEGGTTATSQPPVFADVACAGTAVVTSGVSLVVCGPMKAVLNTTGGVTMEENIRTLLIDVGISEEDASFYEQIIREGGIIVSLAPHFQDLSRLGGLMNQYFGEHISYCKPAPVE